MRNKPLITFHKQEKPNKLSVFLVNYKMRCTTLSAASLLFPFIWGDFRSNLDWLDLEMEANEGEHQALQILQELILITQLLLLEVTKLKR